MTVCVAALFSMSGGNIGVLGASDRMLTAPDVQYEPHEQPKIYYVTNSIQIMTAGDSTLQAALLQRVRKEVHERAVLEEDRWLDVKEVAEIYAAAYLTEHRAQAEKDVLTPLGLDFDDWMDRQLEMQPDLVTEIAKELYRYELPHVSAIVAGVDLTGAHIYVVRGSQAFCHDKTGFAAIGIGKNHASSEFMFAGHSSHRPYPETFLLTHRAKKRAEAAPGVGSMTDMFFIGPQIGTYTRVPQEMVEYLDSIFVKVEEEKKQTNLKAEGEINEFFKSLERERRQQLAQEKQQRLQGGTGTGGEEPAEQGVIREESQKSESQDGVEPASRKSRKK